MMAVLAEVHRVLRANGRLGVVAMAETGKTNPMIDLYQWAHRHWPHLVDCRPINVASVLQAPRFQTETAAASAIWTLPVVVAIGVKASVESKEGPTT